MQPSQIYWKLLQNGWGKKAIMLSNCFGFVVTLLLSFIWFSFGSIMIELVTHCVMFHNNQKVKYWHNWVRPLCTFLFQFHVCDLLSKIDTYFLGMTVTKEYYKVKHVGRVYGDGPYSSDINDRIYFCYYSPNALGKSHALLLRREHSWQVELDNQETHITEVYHVVSEFYGFMSTRVALNYRSIC